jgi:hypothetical protein
MSIMTRLPNFMSRPAGRAILHASKHSPLLLTGVAVVGVVATAVAASKATLKLEDILDETHSNLDKARTLRDQDREDYTESDYKTDVITIYTRTTVDIVKLYAPAIGIGVVTIASVTGSYRILNRRNAALSAAYKALDEAFKRYRERVVKVAGKEMDQVLRYDTEHDKVEDNKIVNLKASRNQEYSMYARFFDELNPKWNRDPEFNFIFIRCQQNFANDLLLSRGHVFLNEVYDMLGIERTRAGQVVGWIVGKDGDNHIDFGVFDVNNQKARDFVNGREGAILLDFNVDGVIYDKI